MELMAILSLSGAVLVLVGLAMWACGVARSKSAAGVLLTTFTCAAAGVIGFFVLGLSIAMQTQNPVFGFSAAGLYATTLGPLQIVMLGLPVLATAPLAGAVAERSKFWPTVIVAGALGAIVLPILIAWCGDNGFLGRMGTDRYSPIGIALLIGATAALTSAWCIGPRAGKFNRDGSTTFFPGHNLPIAVIGIGIALAGLMLAAGAAGAIVAGTFAMIAGLLHGQHRYGKPDLVFGMTGLLAGAVLATALPSGMPNWALALLGLIVGALGPWAAVQVELIGRIDEPTTLAKPLGAAVALAMLIGPLLASGTAGTRLKLFGTSLLALLLVTALTAAATFALWKLMPLLGLTIRASESDEYDGADLASHDINAYPDFQQTMIKSHHLRQA